MKKVLFFMFLVLVVPHTCLCQAPEIYLSIPDLGSTDDFTVTFTALSEVWVARNHALVFDIVDSLEVIVNNLKYNESCRKFYFDYDGNGQPGSIVVIGRAEYAIKFQNSDSLYYYIDNRFCSTNGSSADVFLRYDVLNHTLYQTHSNYSCNIPGTWLPGGSSITIPNILPDRSCYKIVDTLKNIFSLSTGEKIDDKNILFHDSTVETIPSGTGVELSMNNEYYMVPEHTVYSDVEN